MTAPRWYSSPAPPDEDFVFPESEPTFKVKARCRCGVRAIANLRMSFAFVRRLIAREPIRPEDVAGRAWCRDCDTAIKVRASDLHLA